VGGINPQIIFSRVDLPEPKGAIIDVKEFSLVCDLISRLKFSRIDFVTPVLRGTK
jgi:hypothetical protein